jgi:hypothetical protein
MEWISVEKKLPKRGQMVIWFHPKIVGDRGTTHQDYYRVNTYNLPSRPATHWMPLPEPPK